jgi:replicative DNA helicase
LLVAPTGVGKTTLAGLLVRALIGYEPTEVLGFPVRPSRCVLYLAMDRPGQARRALTRQIHPDTTGIERLMFQKGPLRDDLGRTPGALLELVEHVGADVVIIDSLKDVTSKLSDDRHGSPWPTISSTSPPLPPARDGWSG